MLIARALNKPDQVGPRNRYVVAVAKAGEKRKRLQLLLLVSLRGTVHGNINIKITNAKPGDGALHAPPRRNSGDNDSPVSRLHVKSLQERFHLGPIKTIVGVLNHNRLVRLGL